MTPLSIGQVRGFNSAASAVSAEAMAKVNLESASSTDGDGSDGSNRQYRGPSVNIKTPKSEKNVPIKLIKGKQFSELSLLQERLGKLKQ